MSGKYDEIYYEEAQARGKVTWKNYALLIGVIALMFGLFYLMTHIGEEKTPATYERVWEVIEKHDLTPVDAIDVFTEKVTDLEVESVIACRDDDLYIDFVTLETTDDAYNMYMRYNSNIVDVQDSTGKDFSENLRNYRVRVYSIDDEYFYLMKIENTVLYCRGTSKTKSLIKEIANELGYTA